MQTAWQDKLQVLGPHFIGLVATDGRLANTRRRKPYSVLLGFSLSNNRRKTKGFHKLFDASVLLIVGRFIGGFEGVSLMPAMVKHLDIFCKMQIR